MLATGHQVVSSVTTREIVISAIAPASPCLARGELLKAQTIRVFADFLIPIFQGANATRATAQTSELLGTIKSTSFGRVCIIDYF